MTQPKIAYNGFDDFIRTWHSTPPGETRLRRTCEKLGLHIAMGKWYKTILKNRHNICLSYMSSKKTIREELSDTDIAELEQMVGEV